METDHRRAEAEKPADRHLTQQTERQRIARDLHDILGHTLSMITLKSELAEKLVRRDPERAVKEIHDVQTAFIAEDQGMVRGALAALLSLEDDIEVLAEAADGVQALERIGALQPDICLLDIEMPGMSGLDVAEAVQKNKWPCRLVMLTTFARPGYLQRALKAGVNAYLLKDAPVEELAKALRTVYTGGRVISPELALSVWDEANPLTERDQEVLALAAEGLTTAQIAKRLFLSEGTVRNYVSEILHKLGAKNRVEALKIAQTKGWL